MSYEISASFLFSGLSDYWSGNGRRNSDDAGCLFAFLSPTTTLGELIDQWVNDFESGGDCDSFPEEITSGSIRAALLAMLTPESKLADKFSGNPVCECERAEDCECWGDCIAIVLIEISPKSVPTG